MSNDHLLEIIQHLFQWNERERKPRQMSVLREILYAQNVYHSLVTKQLFTLNWSNYNTVLHIARYYFICRDGLVFISTYISISYRPCNGNRACFFSAIGIKIEIQDFKVHFSLVRIVHVYQKKHWNMDL